jgi:hypothetical protein
MHLIVVALHCMGGVVDLSRLSDVRILPLPPSLPPSSLELLLPLLVSQDFHHKIDFLEP